MFYSKLLLCVSMCLWYTKFSKMSLCILYTTFSSKLSVCLCVNGILSSPNWQYICQCVGYSNFSKLSVCLCVNGILSSLKCLCLCQCVWYTKFSSKLSVCQWYTKFYSKLLMSTCQCAFMKHHPHTKCQSMCKCNNETKSCLYPGVNVSIIY